MTTLKLRAILTGPVSAVAGGSSFVGFEERLFRYHEDIITIVRGVSLGTKVPFFTFFVSFVDSTEDFASVEVIGRRGRRVTFVIKFINISPRST